MRKKVVCLVLTLCALALILSGCDLLGAVLGAGGGSTSKDLIIYELYTAGGYSSGENYSPYTNSYVILYNMAKKDLDMSGYELHVADSPGGNMVANGSTKLSGIIKPEAFYVIELGKTDEAPEVPHGEALPFSINFDAKSISPKRTEGVIAISKGPIEGGSVKSSDPAIVDLVGYSNNEQLTPSGVYEGKGPAVGNSVKKVLRRTAYKDTNNNSLDFMTKDIIDKPANIINYKEGLLSTSLDTYEDYTKATVNFSHTSGYYDKEFELSLTTDLGSQVKIYYTTDGSQPLTPLGKPSATAKEYSSPIRIYDRTGEPSAMMGITGLQKEGYKDPMTTWPPERLSGESDSAYNSRLDEMFRKVYKATAIRAAAVNENKVVTPTVAGSFFVGAKNFAARYNMPVVSLITDQDGLFNKETGIFMFKNLEERSVDFERPLTIQFFEKDGTLAFQENAKIKLNGGYTRIFPQRSLRINMSNINFNYDLFAGAAKDSAGKVINYFDRFVLRSGGNDWGGGATRDAFFQRYCGKLGTFDFQATRPVVAFINGEFWGMYQMIERQDEYYISTHYGIAKEDVTIAESFTAKIAGSWDDVNELSALMTFINENDMSIAENYKKFTDAIDVDSYIDYFCCELYGGNRDWPHNNLELWKNSNKNATENKKWRLMMCDVDFTLWSNSGAFAEDPIHWIMNEPKDKKRAYMFSSLMKNEEFKTQFISRFEYLLDNFFVYSEMSKELRAMRSTMETAVPEHFARWDLPIKGWTDVLSTMETYIQHRNAVVKSGLDKIK